jgi:hypothetical protein
MTPKQRLEVDGLAQFGTFNGEGFVPTDDEVRAFVAFTTRGIGDRAQLAHNRLFQAKRSLNIAVAGWKAMIVEGTLRIDELQHDRDLSHPYLQSVVESVRVATDGRRDVI